MLRHDFIQEIIVWNNNPKAINLNDLDLQLEDSIIKIINLRRESKR